MITAGLQPKTNETKTMGTRHTGPARAAGEGTYRLLMLTLKLAPARTNPTPTSDPNSTSNPNPTSNKIDNKSHYGSDKPTHRKWLLQASLTLCTW